jgi:hypothetical protein
MLNTKDFQKVYALFLQTYFIQLSDITNALHAQIKSNLCTEFPNCRLEMRCPLDNTNLSPIYSNKHTFYAGNCNCYAHRKSELKRKWKI